MPSASPAALASASVMMCSFAKSCATRDDPKATAFSYRVERVVISALALDDVEHVGDRDCVTRYHLQGVGDAICHSAVLRDADSHARSTLLRCHVQSGRGVIVRGEKYRQMIRERQSFVGVAGVKCVLVRDEVNVGDGIYQFGRAPVVLVSAEALLDALHHGHSHRPIAFCSDMGEKRREATDGDAGRI